MMVLFVSECEKKALTRTRRVLDAFANRIGQRTWLTVITEEGLHAVKSLLRKTASKNTAVACHWLRSRSRCDLLWVVGNQDVFNEQGVVAVNYTDGDIDQFMDKSQWNTINIIQYAAAIAGLFHDFGKANNLFQQKIDPKSTGNVSEPYRHEWVSMRLFQSFVGTQSDKEWLKALSQIEREAIASCYRDGIEGGVAKNHPLSQLPPFAQLVAWLIVSHHKLPIYPKWKETSPPDIPSVDDWLEHYFAANWNSHNCKDKDKEYLLAENWKFDKGLPIKSIQWRSKACLLASEAITKLQFQPENNYLHDQLFVSNIARMCLMMADHYYSSQKEVTLEWRNEDYEAFANTDRNTKSLKQKLDEHHIGVAHHASEIARKLPRLNRSLKQLERNFILENDVEKKQKDKYGWQDKARKIAQKISEETLEHGFFGINMASTGTGKTQANAKIMYAIGKGVQRVRFSVALGLRTLTLQTGVEYREKLKIDEEDLALLVGGQSVKQLFENERQKSASKDENNEQVIITGSASQDPLLDDDIQIDYKGELDTHSLSQWTNHDERIEKLLQAPVLVSTIDHLMPATEGTRGGKQIAPMLRLLTSDLVLDEPDDFGLDDLPALCRLIHWAGLLGSRVLLSTATMPPALAYALFEAYQAGWKQYAIANIPHWDNHIACAWFDEFDCVEEKYNEFATYKKGHDAFTQKRVKKLNEYSSPKRKGYIAKIERSESDEISNLAKTIHNNILQLHQNHHLSKESKHISIGLVRMANIDPLVAVAKKLLQIDSPDNTLIHYCVYHSRYPLAIRSALESKLDRLLKRHDSETIWQQPDVANVLTQHPQSNHVFVVIASPVAEVGRDHDYDWAVVEPSSMRSIIQLAGRILRHRDHIPETPNVCLLNQNYRALCKNPICFERPGFESSKLTFSTSHKLEDLVPREQYESITAIPKIVLPDNKADMNLIGLEHKAIATQLFGEKTTNGQSTGGARVWWKNHPHWCGEVQHQQRFRDSKRDEAYYLWLEDEYLNEKWQWKNENVYPAKFAEPLIEIKNVELLNHAQGCGFWFELDAKSIYASLTTDFSIELSEVSQRFGEIRLVQYEEGDERAYCYHPNLGVYQEI
jgi:CRISPR-associated endonuclease/helicase Cas3